MASEPDWAGNKTNITLTHSGSGISAVLLAVCVQQILYSHPYTADTPKLDNSFSLDNNITAASICWKATDQHGWSILKQVRLPERLEGHQIIVLAYFSSPSSSLFLSSSALFHHHHHPLLPPVTWRWFRSGSWFRRQWRPFFQSPPWHGYLYTRGHTGEGMPFGCKYNKHKSLHTQTNTVFNFCASAI